MVSTIGSVVAPIVNAAATPLFRQLGYLFNTRENMKDLDKISKELNLTKDEVEEQIAAATAASDETVPTERMKQWKENVLAMEDVVRKIDKDYHCRTTCVGGCPINCWSSYRIAKRAAKATAEARELANNRPSFDIMTKRSAPAIRRMLTLPDDTPSSSSGLYLKMACECLQQDGVGMVGIWGMGGVGKTTLLQRINNHPSVEAAGFDYVILVVASQDLNLGKLQKDIAERVGLVLGATSTVESQALTLYRYLKMKNFLLLLDDIWEPLDLAKLGIPCDGIMPKRKVVFTTRSETICHQMMACQKLLKTTCKKIKVECLRPAEAWQLFLCNIGEDLRCIIGSDSRVRSRAAKVASKCDGLPLAVVVTARAMSANWTWREWEAAIDSLDNIGVQELWSKETDPFPVLKVSYDHLPNDSAKMCFLCCALWPEDENIWEDDLINCWMGMNLIDVDNGGFGTAYSKGYAIIQVLKRACLLEKAEDCNFSGAMVKMHDVIRGMVLWMISDCKKKWIVKNRGNLKDGSEDAKEWREAQVISLMYGRSGILPRNPDCPNLSSLMLQNNSINVIPEGFFQNMHALTYLDLSHNEISDLPPAIGRLRQLRHLALSNTSLCSLPVELGSLSELRRLLLTNTERLRRIPQGLISALQKLELLAMCNTAFDGWDTKGQASTQELVRSKITSLTFDVRRFQVVEQLSKNQSMSLWLVVMRDLEGVTTLPLQSLLWIGNARSTLLQLLVWNCVSLEEISISGQCEEECFDNLERIELKNLPALKKITLERVVSGSLLRNIRFLMMKGCAKLKNATWILHLSYLESLAIQDCPEMERVIGNEEVATNENENLVIFPNLNHVVLMDLPNLRSFSTRALALPSLKYLPVVRCPKLDKSSFFSSKRRKNVSRVTRPSVIPQC